jgi:hypothetical protein
MHGRAMIGVWLAVAGDSVRDTVTSVADQNDQIIMALIALIGTSIAALVYTIRNNSLGKTIAKDAYEANKAVNNIGPGEHRLYDIVTRIEAKQDDFDRKWGNLPDDMDDAVGMAELLHSMQRTILEIGLKLDQHVELTAHQYQPLPTIEPTAD